MNKHYIKRCRLCERQFVITNGVHRRKHCYKCLPMGANPATNFSKQGHALTCKECGKRYIYKSSPHMTIRTCKGCTRILKKRAIKDRAVQYKGGKCIKCGYNKSTSALVFHHRNPKNKDFNVAHKFARYSWGSIQKELDKCDLLCYPCHIELHETLNRHKNRRNPISIVTTNDKVQKTYGTKIGVQFTATITGTIKIRSEGKQSRKDLVYRALNGLNGRLQLVADAFDGKIDINIPNQRLTRFK